MNNGANLTVLEKRYAARHAVDHATITEHRKIGDIKTHIVNISAKGFMTEGEIPIENGERITVRMPVIGRIEAHKIWSVGSRSGFQFERVIRLNEFVEMIDNMRPSVARHDAHQH